MEIVVPDLGDFSDVEIIECLVAPGDQIEAEAPLITIETDKAAMDVPSPAAGRLAELKVAVGDRVSTGDVIGVLETPETEVVEASESADAPSRPASESSGAAEEVPADAGPFPTNVAVPDLGDFADVEIVEILAKVGDTVTAEDGLFTVETDKAAMDVPAGVAGLITDLRVALGDKVNAGDVVAVIEVTASEPAKAPSPQKPAPAPPAAASATPSAAPKASAPRAVPFPAIDEASFGKAHASPSVRKLARELGVNLGSVQGSGRKQRVTAEDVKNYVKQIMLAGGVATGPALPQVPDVDHAKFGEIETVALTRIQKISGPRLHASWVNLPHVTQNDLADITDLEAHRQANKAAAAEQGVKLTPLAYIMRACAIVLEEFPVFRSSLASDGNALVMKHYLHLGFAADTPNGLVVPVIRDVDQKSLTEVAGELVELSGRAREGKLKAADMHGGVFTVSSLGGIGGTYFTPIINAPEVAILGVSRSSMQPVFTDDTFVPRLMLPLSLSYDHRVIDGAAGARFVTRLSAVLGDIDLLTGKHA